MFRQMLVSVIFMLSAFVGNAQGNSTGAPTMTMMSNSTGAPTMTMMSNSTGAPTMAAMSNSTGAPTMAAMSNSTSAPTMTMMSNSTSAPTMTMMSNSSSAPTAAMMSNSSSAPTMAMMSNSTEAPTAAMMSNSSSAPTAAMMSNSTEAPTGVPAMTGAPTGVPAMTPAPTGSMSNTTQSNSTMYSYVVLSTTITIDAGSNCGQLSAFTDALKTQLASQLGVATSAITIQVSGACAMSNSTMSNSTMSNSTMSNSTMSNSTMGRRLLATTTLNVFITVPAASETSATATANTFLTPSTVADIASTASLTLTGTPTVATVATDGCMTAFNQFQQVCGCPASMTSVTQCPNLCSNYNKNSTGCMAAIPKSSACSATNSMMANLASNVGVQVLLCQAVSGAAQVSVSIVAFILAAAFL